MKIRVREERRKREGVFLFRKVFFGACYVVVFFGSVGALAWLAAFSPWVSIDRVDIQSGDGIDGENVRSLIFEQMERRAFWFIPQKSTLFFQTNELTKTLQSRFALNDIVVKKHFPQGLSVAIHGSAFRAFWQTGEKRFRIDPDGRRREEVSLISPLATGTLLFIDEETNEHPEGTTVLSRDGVVLSRILSERFTSLGTDMVALRTKKNSITLEVLSQEGWVLRITTLGDGEAQLRRADLLLREKIKNQRKKLEYIDVRFEGRGYYKLKGASN